MDLNTSITAVKTLLEHVEEQGKIVTRQEKENTRLTREKDAAEAEVQRLKSRVGQLESELQQAEQNRLRMVNEAVKHHKQINELNAAVRVLRSLEDAAADAVEQTGPVITESSVLTT